MNKTRSDELWGKLEDYETKGFWMIDVFGVIEYQKVCDLKPVKIEYLKENGNYFLSEEEAEKAVEKLKAWKRLQDEGFRFKGWRTADLGADKYYFVITAESDGADKDDLDTLFSEAKNEFRLF